jgi:hypothetical protein
MILRFTKIHYNRYIGELWMWMIFFEWINTIIFDR